MGLLLDDLDDHEGYAARRLPDGSLTGTWTAATAAFTGYVACCGCGWHASTQHPPTQGGEEAAEEQWLAEHGQPQLARRAERRRTDLARVLDWLGSQADQLQDPAALQRVGRTVDRARGLAAEVQRDQERAAEREREAGHQR
jgi:hypothetical protein